MMMLMMMMVLGVCNGFISVHEGVDKAIVASGIVKQLERDILSKDNTMRFKAFPQLDVETQIAGDKTIADKTVPTRPDGYVAELENNNPEDKWAALENARTMDGNMQNPVQDQNMRFSSPEVETEESSEESVSDLQDKARKIEQNAAIMQEKANSERAALKDQETQLDKELEETEEQIASMKTTIEQQKAALRGALAEEAKKDS